MKYTNNPNEVQVTKIALFSETMYFMPESPVSRGALWDDFSGQFFRIFKIIIFAVLLLFVT